MFCDLLKSAPPNSETFTAAVESLIVLANDLQVKFPVDIANKEEEAPSKSLIESADRRCQSTQSLHSGHSSDELHKDKKLKLDPSGLELQPITSSQDCSCLYQENVFGPHDVKFQMDNGNVVSAHKQIMVAASDFFTAMLSDRYLESMQSEIPIPHVSADVFEFAVHQIYGCTVEPHNEQPSGEAFSLASCSCEVLRRDTSHLQRNCNDTKVQFFLELLAFSDRFMLDGLRTVSEQLLVNLISATSVVEICDLSLRLNSLQLCRHCLSYLLKVNILELPSHLHLFKELFLCTEKVDMVEQLYQLLLYHLKR